MKKQDGIYKAGLVTFFLLQGFMAQAQQEYYPFEILQLPFIDYSQDKFLFPADSMAFERLFTKYDSLILRGTGNINIVHIGGSHIQADIYSNRMRQRLQNFCPGLIAGRGFIFPYNIARTNNPQNYAVKYTGTWESCKNTRQNHPCTIGLSGYTITTADSTASIYFKINPDSAKVYDFNRVKIFYKNDVYSYRIEIDTPAVVREVTENKTLGYSLFYFENYTDELQIKLKKTDTLQHIFEFYGISFENEDPGVTYHSVGVNGAKLSSFLQCSLFEPHLLALEPDWVIISIGTNDAYTRRFNGHQFKSEYFELIEKIRHVAPGTAILLTVPNDSYLYRRYVNRNTEKMKNIIFDLAEEYNCGIWDFYSIMGGLNSSYIWYMNGMMKYDRIHFNKRGYLLKGDLFFNAFLDSYENHITMTNLLNATRYIFVRF